jgi:hypothetical protein
VKKATTILGLYLSLGILFVGCEHRVTPNPPAPSLTREDRMRQMFKALSLTRGQAEELQKQLRNIDGQRETISRIDADFQVSLSEFKGRPNKFNPEETRKDACPAECQRLAKAYDANAMKLRAAYKNLDEALGSFFEVLNRSLSQQRLTLIYGFVNDELSLVSLRVTAVASQHSAPEKDSKKPPYPRSHLPQAPPPEISVRGGTPPARLKEQGRAYMLSPATVVKPSIKGPLRAMPAGPVNSETVRNLFQGVSRDTAVSFLQDLFSIADKILTEQIGRDPVTKH